MNSTFFFYGSTHSKLDDKNRFVLPQQMRYGLIENGKLNFTLALGLGGCVAIYKTSDIQRISQQLLAKQHLARYQKFFRYFFSNLYNEITCDKLGRVLVPPDLKRFAKIESEIVIAGVLNRIEIWPKEKYEKELEAFFEGNEGEGMGLTEELFACLDPRPREETVAMTLEEQEAYEGI